MASEYFEGYNLDVVSKVGAVVRPIALALSRSFAVILPANHSLGSGQAFQGDEEKVIGVSGRNKNQK